MKKIIENDNNDIGKLVEGLHSELLAICPDKKRKVAAAVLATEEILLLYKEALDSFRASAEILRDVKRLVVSLKIPGERLAPESVYDGDTPKLLSNILENGKLEMVYSYENGYNCVSLVVEQYAPLRDNILFALKNTGNGKKYLVLGILIQLFATASNLIMPYFSSKLIVNYTENSFYQIIAVAAVIFALNVIYHTTHSAVGILYKKSINKIYANLQTFLSREMISIRDEVFEEKGTGPFISCLTHDLNDIAVGLSLMADIGMNAAYYVGTLIAILLVDYRVFLCELFTLCILFVVEKVRRKNYDTDSRLLHGIQEKRNGLYTEIINGESDIKLLNANGFFDAKMNGLADEEEKTDDYMTFRKHTAEAVGADASSLCFFGITVLLGYLLFIGENDMATTLVLFNYFTIIGNPFILRIQQLTEISKKFHLSCERVRNVLDGTEYPKESYGNVSLAHINGDITLENVYFAYNHENISEEDRNIIKGVSLDFHKGETVAIVGKSGSGKTTLLRLISQQRKCSSGRILIDGYNIEDLDRDTLRSHMTAVTQSPYFYNFTIRENLLVAKPDATENELKRVCEAACILEDIENIPQGFDSVLGEKGVRMSGGQKQRLAIARSLLKGSEIILLDEATSSIDNITQAKIKKVLEKLHNDHTIIMIAHRLSTVIDADRIILIDDGKVVAQGTHEELIKNCESYRELYNAEKQ